MTFAHYLAECGVDVASVRSKNTSTFTDAPDPAWGVIAPRERPRGPRLVTIHTILRVSTPIPSPRERHEHERHDAHTRTRR